MQLHTTINKLFTKPTLYDTLYSVGFVLLAVGLPLSKWLTGMSVFWIMGAWLVDVRWKQKINLLQQNKYKLLASTFLFILTLIGVMYSQLSVYAINDLRHKLPLLLIPFVLSQTRVITASNLKLIMQFFIASTSFAALICVINFFYKHITDPRDISIFISHIRFSLFICFSITACVYYYFNDVEYKRYYIVGGCMLLFFLFFLQSVTGIVILALLAVSFVLHYTITKRRPAVLVVIAMLVATSGYLLYIQVIKISNSFSPSIVVLNASQTTTKLGNALVNLKYASLCENGEPTNTQVNWAELNKYWKLRTNDSLLSVANIANGQQYTLLRFLASKHVTKDAMGVMALSNNEIRSIKNGATNYLYMSKINPMGRLYALVYEYTNFKHGLNPNGHSVVMRLHFVHNSWRVFLHNKWFGAGTGNIDAERLLHYQKMNINLDKKNWLHAHNQLLTLLATFGCVGFVLLLIAWLYVIKTTPSNALFTGLIIIIAVSFLNEDTLETQAGVAFYGLFLNLFLFFTPNYNSQIAH
jgi:hypothetical protein